MDRVECPTPAYNQLVKTGLAKQILEQKKLVHNLLSGFYLPADKPNSEENLEDRERAHIKKTYPIYEKAHQVWNNPSRGISDESEIARDVLDFLKN